jgi:KDO2-lipid IV(A) lauroyltransferase
MQRILKLTRLEGEEHLQAALARGRGAILLSAHFTTLEIGARALASRIATSIMYRPTRNVVLERFLMRNRGPAREARDSARRHPTLITALKSNEPVWYAPDQSYRKKGAEMVQFFTARRHEHRDVEAGAHDGAAVLPYFPGSVARIAWLPHGDPADAGELSDDDPAADARRFNELIEAQVRRVPAQYLWIHRGSRA